MRIGIEGSTWTNPRGYGRFTREIVRALAESRARHEFVLVLDSGAARARDLPDLPKVEVATRVPVGESATADRSRSVVDMWRMAAALGRFDGVLFPTLYSFVPVRPGPFVVVVVHDALPETMPSLVLGSRRARILWRLKSLLACRRANLLATVSEASADEIRRRMPVGRAPILVLTEGADEIFTPTRGADDEAVTARYAPSGCRYVLYVGGSSPHKRVPDLIRAFAAVAGGDARTDVRLVLAGPITEDAFTTDGGLEAAVLAAGLGPRVVRTGFVPDATLAALYRRASAVVLPSSLEGFGLPALEAMASGTTVVVRRTPALEEVCGPAAVYFDSVEDLARALARALDAPDIFAAVRAEGIVRARRFGWAESARRLLEGLEAAQKTVS